MDIQEACTTILQHHVEGAMSGLKNSVLFMDMIQEVHTAYTMQYSPSPHSIRIVSAVVHGTGLAMGYRDVSANLIDYVAGVMAIYAILIEHGDEPLQ